MSALITFTAYADQLLDRVMLGDYSMVVEPEAFLRAAEGIDSGREPFACHAIAHEKEKLAGAACRETDFFRELFFDGSYRGCAYFSKPGGDRNAERSHRVIALLMAYHIAKDAQKKARAKAREARRVANSIRIDVTKSDIASGRAQSACECPIAKATRRKRGPYVAVCQSFILINGSHYTVPNAAKAFIDAFDVGKPVKPISFRIRRKAQ